MAAVAGVVLAAGVSQAGQPNGLVLRAVGFFKGKEDITQDQIKCEVPTLDAAITDGNYNMGLWNTYGSQTLFFPDRNNPFANPCGGYLQMRNNMTVEGITVDRVLEHFRIAGARRYRDLVPTAKKFPVACQQFRNFTYYVGTRLDGAANTVSSSESGAPNVAFTQLLPIVSVDLINCLRAEYTPKLIPANGITAYSLPLIAKINMHGVADNGDGFWSNTVSYTLNLRHTCGNGRVDDGESCDPSSLANTCHAGPCTSGQCTGASSVSCTTDADCDGTCVAEGDPEECSCLF
jgi:hypothetical protein